MLGGAAGQLLRGSFAILNWQARFSECFFIFRLPLPDSTAGLVASPLAGYEGGLILGKLGDLRKGNIDRTSNGDIDKFPTTILESL